MGTVITAKEPMTLEELRRLAPHRKVLNDPNSPSWLRVVALKAYGPMIREIAIVHELPATGGKYNMLGLDGHIYLQWWSDEFVASFKDWE
jgi:hypothetical protein